MTNTSSYDEQLWASFRVTLHNGIKHLLFTKQCAANMRQWIASALVQIMACRLLGSKSLYKPVLGYCQLDVRHKLQWNCNKIQNFHSQNTSETIIFETAATLSMGYESITVLQSNNARDWGAVSVSLFQCKRPWNVKMSACISHLIRLLSSCVHRNYNYDE